MEIKNIKFNPVFTVSVSSRLCGICQQSLNMTCGICLHPSVCGPVSGKCGHVYHKHCFDNWYKLNKNCPICRDDWHQVFNQIIISKKRKQIKEFNLDLFS